MSAAAQPALAPAPLHVLLVGNKAEDFYLIREMLGRANCMLALAGATTRARPTMARTRA